MTRALVVLVPDYKGDCRSLLPLKKFLESNEGLKDSEWLEFDYLYHWTSNKKPETVALDLASQIQFKCENLETPIDEIILAGYSMGSILVRRTFLDALGYGYGRSGDYNWVEHVSRIILMGGFGRGFILEEQPFTLRVWLKPVVLIGRLLNFGKLRLEMISGSEFISNLRIDWINYNKSADHKCDVIHLLGNEDLTVDSSNVLDIEQFPNAIAVGVPHTDHENIVFPIDGREHFILKAFTSEIESNRRVKVDREVERVIFLLHGIRDSKRCFEDVVSKLSISLDNTTTKIIVPTYGYLSARLFLSTSYRNSLVPWFTDQYTECLAKYPNAQFYFAGHSNGTYVFGMALSKIKNMIFERAYLAASVLPRTFDWKSIYDRNQVKLIRADMGTEDWPVGVLCHSLNEMGVKSIGSGGFQEFNYGDISQIIYNRFKGGHGSMFTELNTDSIAEYLLMTDQSEKITVSDEELKESGIFGMFVKFGDMLLPLIAGLFLLILGVIAVYYSPIGIFFSMLMCVIVWMIFGRF